MKRYFNRLQAVFYDIIGVDKKKVIDMKDYQIWLNEPNLDTDLKNQLNQMSESEIKDAFYKHLEFGTAGARQLMGPGINRLNIYTVKRLALGFAKYIKLVSKSHNRSVAISYDNRINSKLFAYTCARVLAAEGIKTFITKDLRPTPYLSYMVRHFNCDGGIMITASHNPKAYNGFKAYDKTGAQLVPKLADKLTKEIEKINDYFYIQERYGDLIVEIDEVFDVLYLSEVKNVTLRQLDKPLKFVYSPLHGTGSTLMPQLMDDVGYQFYYVKEEMINDGTFPHTKSSNPEELDAYQSGLKIAKEIDAAAVLVTDPDADRLGLMVKHQGKYVFLNGNQTAALEAYYILSTLKEKNTLPKDGIIYMSTVTTPLLKDIAKGFDIEVKEVLTGFKYIGEQIEKSDKTYLFGAEESYGSLIKPFVRDKDALQAVLLLVEMITYYHLKNQSLYDVLLTLYAQYQTYSEETISLTYKGIEGLKQIKSIMAHFRDNPLKLEGETLDYYEDFVDGVVVKDNQKTPLDFDYANMIKFYYQSGHQIILRPSGTEPKIKIYLYISGKTLTIAEQSLALIKETIEMKIKEIR